MQRPVSYNSRPTWKSLFGVLLCQLVVAESGAHNIGRNLPSAPVTVSCIEQDKPPCLIEIKYLCDPGGSNPVRIKLAHPITDRRTNSANVPYFSVTNATWPVDNGLDLHPGVNWLGLPQGQSLVLPHGFRMRNHGQLISVEELKPAVPAPRLSPSAPTVIAITNPKEITTSHPIVELKGVCNKPLKRIRYDLINSIGRRCNQPGFVTDTCFDTARWEETTNYFECTDITLVGGTNLIALGCEDYQGHWVTTNLIYVLRFNHTPPSVSIQWPRPGEEVSGDSFLVRGQVDDIAARVFGQISAEGRVKTVEGIVERNGRFWVENIPFLARTNALQLKVTDAAGNTTTTNLLVVRSDHILTIDPVPARQLWQLQVTVTGKVSPANQEVWLNGRQAAVKSDGTWVASGVPLTKGGVAIFEALAVPKSVTPTAALTNVNSATAPVVPGESVAVQTTLAPSQITLNSSRPAYGTFRLHLTGTRGRSFILSASVNLVDWMPILTNRTFATGPCF